MFCRKNLFITYFLWFFFGWMGLHHFYLRRDKQAFVWWSTLGGILFSGWVRDLWRIPEYVDEANEEESYIETLKNKLNNHKIPRFNFVRFAGEMSVGYFYGVLVRLAIPDEVTNSAVGMMISIGIASGVYLVGNIGREEGPFRTVYAASFATWNILRLLSGPEVSYMYCSVAASCTFNYHRKYKKTYVKKTFGKRFLNLSMGVLLIWILWGSFMYFNASVTLENGEKVKFRDSVNNFLKSPAWLDFKNTLTEIYKEGQKTGWKSLYNDLVEAMDPTGVSHACNVLEVSRNAGEEEIRKSYKKLVVKWHPDKYKGEDKERAQRKFMEIQSAYEMMSSKRKSSGSRQGKDRTEF